MMKKLSQTLVAGGMTIVSFAVAIVASEGIVRLCGHKPRPLDIRRSDTSRGYQRDDLLGWRPQPGTRTTWHEGRQEELTSTIDEDGRRTTGPRNAEAGPLIACVGCSFTEGYELNDHETWPYKLQQMLPDARIDNYGCAGYGTYQCLLVTEKLLSRVPPPDVVVYGLIWHHSERNVATIGWLSLFQVCHAGLNVELPYCTLAQDGSIERRPRISPLPEWPLSHSSALVYLVQMTRARTTSRAREAQSIPVMKQLITDMRAECEAKGVKFVVAVLELKDYDWRAWLKEENFAMIDCTYERAPDMLVTGGTHPNSKATSLVAERIRESIPGILRSEKE